jgi:coenzyme F420-dependent glucose-6-phosphate dehydrogenase
VRYGYKASAEQFGPRPLLSLSAQAEALGLDTVAISDHFQPWRHHGGHSPAALPWLGAAGERLTSAYIGTSVLTPTLRYQPAVIAQAFATLGSLYPDRVFLGVGTGEAMNETPVTGDVWPSGKERRRRLAEAVTLIRTLWTDERVDFEGEYYKVSRATIYDRPDDPVPIYIAASGPLAASMAGRLGDGFICTSGKGHDLYVELLGKVREGAEKAGVEDPIEMERLADDNQEKASSRFIVSDDPEAVVGAIAPYVELGFEELVFHFPGDDQERALEQFSRDVLPRLRERW